MQHAEEHRRYHTQVEDLAAKVETMGYSDSLAEILCDSAAYPTLLLKGGK